MIFIFNSSSYSFDQNEEHFEFTPQFNVGYNDDSIDDDDCDEFITNHHNNNNNNNNSISTNGNSGGGNSSSIKFIQRNSLLNSSFRKYVCFYF